jgi:hypothetical protein
MLYDRAKITEKNLHGEMLVGLKVLYGQNNSAEECSHQSTELLIGLGRNASSFDWLVLYRVYCWVHFSSQYH